MDEKKSFPRHPQEGNFDPPAEKEPDPLFESSDLFLCAFLKARGVIFEGTKRGEGRRIIFIFQRQPDLEALIKEYNNDGSVRVLSFKSALRNLRDILFNEARS